MTACIGSMAWQLDRRGMRVDMFCVRWPVFSMVLKGGAPWEEVLLGERKQEKHGRDADVRMRSAVAPLLLLRSALNDHG
jgi:hypothetical protein